MNFLEFDCKFAYRTGFQLDLTFEANALRTAFCGPSGAGKTTVLKLIAGLIKPSQGRICLGGETWVDTAAKVFVPPHCRRLGLLFQDLYLFPHMRVRDNVLYGRRRFGDHRLEFDHVLSVLEISDLIDRYPWQLSGGQKQRVALARALLASPRMLLLDEPLASVEDELADRIVQLLNHVIETYQIPTIVVSHDIRLVEQISDDVISVRAGERSV